MEPLITIALPVYNGAATLSSAIDSILQQTYTNFELIILDDASTDNSFQIMSEFNDPRIQVVEGKVNAGLSATLNMAVRMAKGSYFARMDQDDLSFPERIEKQVAFLQVNTEIDLLGTNIGMFDDALEVKGKLNVSETHQDICSNPWNGFYLAHPTWMGKLDWFKSNQYNSIADGAEDQNLLLRSYYDSQFACLSDVLLGYRYNKSPLKKKLRARMKYAKASLYSDIKSDIFMLKPKILIMQFIKGIADSFSIVGLPWFERRTIPLDDIENKKLTSLLVASKNNK